MNPFFIKGAILGFVIAAPVGPIGLLCIRRSLAYGQKHGFFTGIGAATADMFYGAVAAFGLTSLSSLLVAQQNYLQLLGGLFLGWIGFQTFRSVPVTQTQNVESPSLFRSYFSTFLLTITNPTTILSFIAAFTSMNLSMDVENYNGAIAITTGVFVGSAIWWLMLSWMASKLRTLMTPNKMKWINRSSGILLLSFSFYALYKGIQGFL